MANGNFLPQFLPLGVVGKLISTLIAILLAYGSLKVEIAEVRTELGAMKAQTQRIEGKLDRLVERGNR